MTSTVHIHLRQPDGTERIKYLVYDSLEKAQRFYESKLGLILDYRQPYHAMPIWMRLEHDGDPTFKSFKTDTYNQKQEIK